MNSKGTNLRGHSFKEEFQSLCNHSVPIRFNQGEPPVPDSVRHNNYICSKPGYSTWRQVHGNCNAMINRNNNVILISSRSTIDNANNTVLNTWHSRTIFVQTIPCYKTKSVFKTLYGLIKTSCRKCSIWQLLLLSRACEPTWYLHLCPLLRRYFILF